MSTPKSLRAQPAKTLENYIVLRSLGNEINLTHVDDRRFLPCGTAGVGYTDDNTSALLDIGFTFNFDGVNYKKFVVNTNGWMVLVDPTSTTFTITEILTVSDTYQNSAIRARAFTKQHVLLAPWFDDLRNVAEKLEQYSSAAGYSSVKSSRVEKGLESFPQVINQARNSVKYFFDEKSDNGRRLIVRWNSISGYNAATATTMLRFEAVVYENGKIEFRYAPKGNINVSSISSYEGATIGLFTSASFRDCSNGLGYRSNARQQYKYGGYVYNSSYTDTDTSTLGGGNVAYYTCMLQPQLHWPSLSDVGAMITLKPPVNRRAILPRLEQRKIDSRLTLPIVKRTGDTRLGNDKVIFDDHKIALYGVQSNINTQNPGAALDDLTWLLPSYANFGFYCDCPNDVTTVKVLQGDPNLVYNVTLRFRGVIELKHYSGTSYTDGNFAIGGYPNDNGAVNQYSLTISDPPATYWLNYTSNTSFDYLVHIVDFTQTVKIRGGATATLYATSNGGEEIDNVPAGGGVLSVPGIANPAQPYAGQFMVVNVISSFAEPLPNSQITDVLKSTGKIIVNYPTTLPRFFADSEFAAIQRQDVFSGDFETTGTIDNFASSQFLLAEDTSKIAPFSETNLFENDPAASTDVFFTTGSSFEIHGDGLQGSLKSKTKLNLTFPIDNSVRLLESCSAIYYYNKRTRCWNVPQNSTYTLTNNGLTASNSKNDIVYDRAPYSAGYSVIEDHKGFGPIGNFLVSGSNELFSGSTYIAAAQTDPSINAYFTEENGTVALSKKYDKTITQNEDYKATDDESFGLPICHPFLIEKAVIEIPFAANDPWFKDKTTCISTLENSGNGFDFGGPAITFALFNQTKLGGKTQRDLILTGVFTHTFDNVKSLALSAFPPVTSTYQLRPEGLLSFGAVPSGLVTPNSGTNGYYYTGSVRLKCESQVSNGLLVKAQLQVSSTPEDNAIGLLQIFNQTKIPLDTYSAGTNNNFGYYDQTNKIAYINNYGRAATGFQPSGRSIFGKEFGTSRGIVSHNFVDNPFCMLEGYGISGSTQAPATVSNLPAPFAEVVTNGSRVVCSALIPFESCIQSPYLVLPGDTLVLAIAKSRPVYMGTQFNNTSKISGSVYHEAQLITGTVNLTLYGSLIREGKEFHDTLNQPLASEAIHEIVVGNEPILDQFEMNYNEAYISSSFDNYVVGSLLTEYTLPHGQIGLAQSQRGRVFSKAAASIAPTRGTSEYDSSTSLSYRLQPYSELAGSSRISQASDITERYFDSLLPAIDKCIKANGAQLIYLKAASGDVVTVDHIILNLDCRVPGDLQVSPDQALYNDWKWTRSFPFEPKYSKATRQLDVSKSFVSSLSIVNNAGVISAIPISPTIESTFVCRSIGSPYPCVPMSLSSSYYRWEYIPTDRPYDETTPYLTDGANSTDLTKFLYGFGDINNMMSLATVSGDGTGGIIGSNHQVDFRQVFYDLEDAYLGVSPIIRGWKYGLYSGLPAFSKAYFRQNRYGQLRDMLEQRPYTKFYLTKENKPVERFYRGGEMPAAVNVQFVDTSGKTTRPENTWSQNLSFEATSSMPYFDGEAKNRTDINVNTLNSNVIALKADQFGQTTL